MKYKTFLSGMPILFILELLVLIFFMGENTDIAISPVEVNEALQSVKSDWGEMENHHNFTTLDYTVIDRNGKVLFMTRPNLSDSINEAITHQDTILDIESDGEIVGKIIIYNNNRQALLYSRKKITLTVIIATALQCLFYGAYFIYLKKVVIKPFNKLKVFAGRVAGGNLDIPLEMDRHNIFGAFTESFDIMRSELKKARIAEALANQSKKELIAKLSHDIRTPVASIKAASEVGYAIADNEKTRQNYTQIIHKADQINTLVTNLFSTTLEELQRLSVEPFDMKSEELSEMLLDADYFHYADIPEIPDCMIYADKLRLQQVFDNIFANSFKYANTKIDIEIFIAENYLAVKIEDYGGGVPEKELPLLKEKFGRGSNSENIDGAGLGLYISDGFMKEMGGALNIENGEHGLCVTVLIPLSGKN